MYSEKKELRIDRIEDGIAVAYDNSGTEYTMCAKIADISECDIIDATVNKNGEVVEVKVRQEETETAKATLKTRLNNLFKK